MSAWANSRSFAFSSSVISDTLAIKILYPLQNDDQNPKPLTVYFVEVDLQEQQTYPYQVVLNFLQWPTSGPLTPVSRNSPPKVREQYDHLDSDWASPKPAAWQKGNRPHTMRRSNWFETSLKRLHRGCLSILRARFDSPPKTIWKGRSGDPKQRVESSHTDARETPGKPKLRVYKGPSVTWVKNHKRKVLNPKVFDKHCYILIYLYTNVFDIREAIFL